MSGPKLPKGPISASELARLKDEMLHDDPEYRMKVEAATVKRREQVQRLRDAEQPIVAGLRDVGVQVDSVWDLVNTADPYPTALPVLMEHLERGGYPERVMESLGRALAVQPSVAIWERLKARWLEARDAGEEDGAAVALAACATEAQLDELVCFLRVEKRRESRIYFIRPILRVGGDRGRQIVQRLRLDPVFGDEATALLKRRHK